MANAAAAAVKVERPFPLRILLAIFVLALSLLAGFVPRSKQIPTATQVERFIIASQDGDFRYVESYIEMEYDVNVRDEYGLTPLMLAVSKGHARVANALLNNGADVNELSNENVTALSFASRFARVDMVRLLLSRGANVNLGFPPLIAACDDVPAQVRHLVQADGLWDRKYEVVIILLQAGADVFITHNGLNAHYFARASKQLRVEALLEQAARRTKGIS